MINENTTNQIRIAKRHTFRSHRFDISMGDEEEFEDTNRVIKLRISKNRQHNSQKTEEQTTQWPKDRRTDNTMAKRKSTKGQTTIYKTYI